MIISSNPERDYVAPYSCRAFSLSGNSIIDLYKPSVSLNSIRDYQPVNLWVRKLCKLLEVLSTLPDCNAGGRGFECRPLRHPLVIKQQFRMGTDVYIPKDMPNAERLANGDTALTLTENQSTYIPLGAVHRLVNPGTIPLEIIEVQSGTYLGEDDIVRLEDSYGRAAVNVSPSQQP